MRLFNYQTRASSQPQCDWLLTRLLTRVPIARPKSGVVHLAMRQP